MTRNMLDPTGTRPVVRLNRATYWNHEGRRRIARAAIIEREGALRLSVWVEVQNGTAKGVEQIADLPVASFTEDRSPVVTMADGTTVELPHGNCLCGSPLKRMSVTAPPVRPT